MAPVQMAVPTLPQLVHTSTGVHAPLTIRGDTNHKQSGSYAQCRVFWHDHELDDHTVYCTRFDNMKNAEQWYADLGGNFAKIMVDYNGTEKSSHGTSKMIQLCRKECMKPEHERHHWDPSMGNPASKFSNAPAAPLTNPKRPHPTPEQPAQKRARKMDDSSSYSRVTSSTMCTSKTYHITVMDNCISLYCRIPVIELEASSDASSPRVLITANIHGDEYVGTVLCHHLTDLLRDQKTPILVGRLMIIPSLNPNGLTHGTKNPPWAPTTDLDSIFDGDKHGAPLVQRFKTELMRKIAEFNPTHHIDLQSADALCVPHIRIPPKTHPQYQRSLDVAKASGISVIRLPSSHPPKLLPTPFRQQMCPKVSLLYNAKTKTTL